MQPARTRGAIDAAEQLGIELTVQIGQQRADRMRAAHDQAARRTVRYVTQSLRDFDDACPRLLGNVRMTIKRARHRGHRDPCFSRDIADRHHHADYHLSGANRVR